MRSLLFTLAIFSLLHFGIIDTLWAKAKTRHVEVPEYGEADSGADSTARTAGARVVPTFLDTMNRSREIALTDEDVSYVRGKEPRDASRAPEQEKADGFRIQCVASRDIGRIRTEKASLEARISEAVYITFDAPYYKLLVGNFRKRSAAEGYMVKIRRLGYPDAWIVRSKVRVR